MYLVYYLLGISVECFRSNIFGQISLKEDSVKSTVERGIHRGLVLFALSCLLLNPSLALGQDPVAIAGAFTITGTIRDADDDTPLQYAVVGVPELGSWAISEADGSYELELATPGTFRFLVVKRGWYLADEPVTFAGADQLDVALQEEQEMDPVGPGRLVGRVLEKGSGKTIGRATVRVTPTGQEVNTDSRGRFMISRVSAGAILVEAERSGFTSSADTLVALPGVTLALDIQLPKGSDEVPSIAIEVWPRYLEAVGFYRRAEGNRGNRFGRLFIQDQNAHRISDILRPLPGLRVERGRLGNTVITTRSTFGGAGRCAMGVFLDNSRMPGFDVDTYPMEWISALEVYEGMDVPPEFNHSCGVILIWSRRPE